MAHTDGQIRGQVPSTHTQICTIPVQNVSWLCWCSAPRAGYSASSMGFLEMPCLYSDGERPFRAWMMIIIPCYPLAAIILQPARSLFDDDCTTHQTLTIDSSSPRRHQQR